MGEYLFWTTIKRIFIGTKEWRDNRYKINTDCKRSDDIFLYLNLYNYKYLQR